MNTKNTSFRSNLGLLAILKDLAEHNIKVALPFEDHLPFDFIAITPDLKLKRVSAKYRKILKGRLIEVTMKSIYANKNGNRIRQYTSNEIDVIAVYCPDTDECYYLDSKEIPAGGVTSLRTLPDTKWTGNLVKRIKFAKDYTNPLRVLSKQ